MKRKFLVLGFFLTVLSAAYLVRVNYSVKEKESGIQGNEVITFSKHIAPIIYNNCTPCHRPGGGGPFNLINYEDVLKKAKTIEEVTRLRVMPPWPADPSYSHFADEKVLTDLEIAMIRQWVFNKTPLGDRNQIPPPPEFDPGSQLGKPDMVVKLPKPYLVKGDNLDRFLIMKVPFELPRDTFVRAIEFVPSSGLAHHVNGHLIRYGNDEKKSVFGGKMVVDAESTPFPEVARQMELANDDGISFPVMTPSVTNYLPGVKASVYPDGIGGTFLSRKNVLLINDIHFGPSPADVFDSSCFNIFFAPRPPERPTLELQLGTKGVSEIIPALVIPPGEIKTFKTRAVVMDDISLITINPHMHLLGKSFLAYALKPGGDTIPLIRIRDWDFRWQYFYTFRKMLKIPKGSVIEVVAVFDNTSNNPNNPNNPPKLVSERDGSMRTTDEMLQFIMTYLPYRPGDENISLENNSLKQR